MVIAHNTAITLRARAETLKQSLTVGVKESEMTALKLTATLRDDFGITAGILHIVKSAR